MIKKCTKCREKKKYIFTGMTVPKKAQVQPRRVYRDEKGIRWYNAQCGECFLKYLKKKRKVEPVKRPYESKKRSRHAL